MCKAEFTVAQWLSAGLEIQRSPVQTLVWAKENLSQVQSEQYHHHSIPLHQTVVQDYLKLSENFSQVQSELYHHQSLCKSLIPEIVRDENLKLLWYSGRVQNLRFQRSPVQTPGVWQNENLSHVQSEQYHYQSLCTRVKYLKLSEEEPVVTVDTLVECRTRDPEVPSWNPGVGKKKISHRSNQNNTTSNPSPWVKYLKMSKLLLHRGRVQD